MTSFLILKEKHFFHTLIKAKWLTSQYDIPEFAVSIKKRNCLHMAWKFHLWFILKNIKYQKKKNPTPPHTEITLRYASLSQCTVNCLPQAPQWMVGVEFFSETTMKTSGQVWFQLKKERVGISSLHPGLNSSLAAQHYYFDHKILGYYTT